MRQNINQNLYSEMTPNILSSRVLWRLGRKWTALKRHRTVTNYLYSAYQNPSVASFNKEVNSWLAKHPLKANGCLANCRLTFLVKEATDRYVPQGVVWCFDLQSAAILWCDSICDIYLAATERPCARHRLWTIISNIVQMCLLFTTYSYTFIRRNVAPFELSERHKPTPKHRIFSARPLHELLLPMEPLSSKVIEYESKRQKFLSRK